MQRLYGVIVLLAFAISSYGQKVDADGYTLEDVKAKVTKFQGLKVTGFTMLGLGGALIGTGIVLMSSAEWESYSTPTSTGMSTSDPQGGAGIIMLAVGIPFTVVGIVLSAVGAKKHREYKDRLNFFAGYDPDKKRMSLYATYNIAPGKIKLSNSLLF
jgi:hypothetical protein